MDKGERYDPYGDVNDPILWKEYSLEPDHNFYRHLPDSYVGENLFKNDWDEWKEKEEKLRLERWRAKEKEHQQDEAFARKESENQDG